MFNDRSSLRFSSFFQVLAHVCVNTEALLWLNANTTRALDFISVALHTQRYKLIQAHFFHTFYTGRVFDARVRKTHCWISPVQWRDTKDQGRWRKQDRCLFMSFIVVGVIAIGCYEWTNLTWKNKNSFSFGTGRAMNVAFCRPFWMLMWILSAFTSPSSRNASLGQVIPKTSGFSGKETLCTMVNFHARSWQRQSRCSYYLDSGLIRRFSSRRNPYKVSE